MTEAFDLWPNHSTTLHKRWPLVIALRRASPMLSWTKYTVFSIHMRQVRMDHRLPVCAALPSILLLHWWSRRLLDAPVVEFLAGMHQVWLVGLGDTYRMRVLCVILKRLAFHISRSTWVDGASYYRDATSSCYVNTYIPNHWLLFIVLNDIHYY